MGNHETILAFTEDTDLEPDLLSMVFLTEVKQSPAESSVFQCIPASDQGPYRRNRFCFGATDGSRSATLRMNMYLDT